MCMHLTTPTSMPPRYAASTLAAKFSLCGSVDERLGGIAQLHTMREALQQAQHDWPSLLARLRRMRAAVLAADGAVVNLSADAPSLAKAVKLVPSLLARLPAEGGGGAASGWAWSAAGGVLVPSHEGLQVPTQVNYVAKLYLRRRAAGGATSVVTRYLRTAYLWDGARAGGATAAASWLRANGRATFVVPRPERGGDAANYDRTAGLRQPARRG